MLGNTAIDVAGGATLAVHAGSTGVFAGAYGIGNTGASLALDAGSALSMADDTTGTFYVFQTNSFVGPGLTINNAALDFDVGSTQADQLMTNGPAVVSGVNTVPDQQSAI